MFKKTTAMRNYFNRSCDRAKMAVASLLFPKDQTRFVSYCP